MNQIDFFEEVCYSKSLKMKAYLKLGISCVCSVLGIGLFIAGITFGIIHSTTLRDRADSQIRLQSLQMNSQMI